MEDDSSSNSVSKNYNKVDAVITSGGKKNILYKEPPCI